MRSKSLLNQFAQYYRPYRGLFFLDFGCAVGAGLLELAFPVAVTLFIDRLLPTGQLGLIAAASLGLLLIYLLSASMNAVVTYWGHMLGINIETDMRRNAFGHLQKLSFGYFDEARTGQLVARLTKDLEEIGEVAHHGPEDLFIAIMTLIGAFLLMLNVHVPLALITLVVVPITAWVTGVYGTRMTASWHRLYGRVAEFNTRIEENVGGIRVVQAFANEDHERGLFDRNNRDYRATKLEAYRLMAATNSLSYLSMRFVQVVTMLAGAWFVVRGDLTAGGFVGFLLLVGVFFRPLDKINSVIETYPKGFAGFQRYLDFMAVRPDIADRPGARAVGRLNGQISFEHVAFAYRAGRPILHDVSFSVAAGETVAFIGESGAGKTTLCSLLPRFYDISAGAIRIDGMDIRDMTLKSLRENIGVVQQDVFLFSGTIRENIAYGRLDASEDEILEAARVAQLESLIASLPAGLDTVIGERGVKLSGGQKQRITIARIFLKNPPIVILDEATSALDAASELEIRHALDTLLHGRTTLIITHRMASIPQHARRMEVKEGVVVAQNA